MPASELLSGSQTTSGTTEHTVTTNPTLNDAVVQFMVDLNDMVAGDFLEIRIKEKVLGGGTQRTFFTAPISHAQATSNVVWVSPAFALMHGWDLSLKATTGTITLPWSVRAAGSITEIDSDTQATSGTTTHTLTSGSVATDGCYQFCADLSDMVAGDVLEFAILEKATSGGTQRIVWTATVRDLQSADDVILFLPGIILLHAWDVTLKALSGTVSVPWSMRQVG